MQITSESESNFFDQLSFFDIKEKTVSQFNFFGNFLSCSLDFTKFVNVGNSFNFFPFSISKIRFGFKLLEFVLSFKKNLFDTFFEKFDFDFRNMDHFNVFENLL